MHPKYIIKVFAVLALSYTLDLKMNAQVLYNYYVISKGDSVELSYPAFRGELYYETSFDMGNWSRVDEPLSASQQIRPDTSMYYRLAIIEGTCDPLYSDTTFIKVVHVPNIMLLKIDTITQVSAVVLAELLDSGELPIINRGACWDDEANPDVNDITSINDEVGEYFWCLLSGLSPGTTYYIRSFAENDSGVGYSNELSFTTLSDLNLPIVNIVSIDYLSPTAANVKGEVVSDGGEPVYDRGFCLDSVTNPVIDGSLIEHAGMGTGSFSSFVNSLLPGTEYYVRAFAINNAGISYSNEMNFTTEYIKTISTVVTVGIDSSNCHEAFISYSVIDDGHDTVLSRGICWSLSPDPTVNNNLTNDGGDIGSFVTHMADLDDDTTYYIRAYATNNIGIAYGDQISLTTEICHYPPLVSASGVTGVTTESAILQARVLSDGNNYVFERGILWDTMADVEFTDNLIQAGSDTGNFEVLLTSLDDFTTYYFKAYAINGIDISLSNEISFTTYNVTDSMIDGRDGQVYQIVQIGGQWWMAENLNYYTSTGSYYYDNDSITYSGFGRLYNWATATALLAVSQTCPAGWHLPSDDELKQLEMFLGMSTTDADLMDWRGTDQGTQLKEGGISGFNALLGGRRTAGGTYVGINSFGFYWTSYDRGGADAFFRAFSVSDSRIERDEYAKRGAFYVRCIEDDEDNIDPIAVCKDITIQLDGTGNAIIDSSNIDNGSSDNYSIATITLSQSSFDCSNIGANTVTLTVTDGNSNSAQCDATVTIEDTVSPVAICQDIIVQLDSIGNAIIDPSDIDNGSSDNCSIATMTLSKSSFDSSDIGANTVTLTVTDRSGNSALCNATVTVENNDGEECPCDSVMGAYLSNRILCIIGSDKEDIIQVEEDGAQWKVVVICNTLPVIMIEEWYPKTDVDTVYCMAHGGNDQVQYSSLTMLTITYGGDGDDQIQGGYGPDIMFGENGNDILQGNDGDDFLCGGNGADILSGGNGNNIIYEDDCYDE